MRSRGLSSILLALPKLGAVGIGGGGRSVYRARRSDGDELFVGSEDECICLGAFCVRTDLVGLERTGERLAHDEGEADSGASCGVGGHNGLLMFKMGLEMSRFSMDGVREDRAFPLIDPVSLVHEKARLGLVRGVFFPGDVGGVSWPTGIKSSTSLNERFNFMIASSPSIVAWREGWHAVL